MTREELKEHCIKQIEMCKTWAVAKGEEPSGKIYEEHKLILELLEQEPRWIPISERLPEEKQMVWVKSNDMYLKKINPCIGWRNGFYWRTYTANGVHIIQYPIAWKSCKLESEDKE